MENTIYSIIDIETSGPHTQNDRIIEIAIIQTRNGEVINEYETLINPGVPVPEFIYKLTGIRPEDLQQAPSFEEVKSELFKILNETVIVAHNANFDYSFLQSEFNRNGLEFENKHLCTVRLSRKLFPMYRKHSLDALMERFEIVCSDRHRAMGDARVVSDFLKLLPDHLDQEIIDKSIYELQKEVVLPPGLRVEDFQEITTSPGAYVFYDEKGQALYVGKGKSLKTKVMSHFSNDKSSPLAEVLFEETKSFEVFPTAGEVGAFVLESELNAKLRPIHKKKFLKQESMVVIYEIQDAFGYKKTSIGQLPELDKASTDKALGIFRNQDSAEQFLKSVVKEYLLCETDSTQCSSPFCLGACRQQEPAQDYNDRFDLAFSDKKLDEWPFPGAILLKEKNASGGDFFIFDSWCLVARGKFYDGYQEIVPSSEQNFDKEVYSLLRSYLRKKFLHKFKPLTREEVSNLLS